MVLQSNSYLHIENYEPQALKELQKVLAPLRRQGIYIQDANLAGLANNMIIKLGFMFLARNYVKRLKSKQDSHIYLTYHFFNFVFDTKSFLDAVAMILNYFYNLGYAKGDIDFKKTSFFKSLNKKSPNLGKEISKHKKWLYDVIKWRDSLIHRLSPLIETVNDEAKNDFLIPSEPVTFLANSTIEKYARIPKYDGIVFCETWINNAKDIFENTCHILADELVKKKKKKHKKITKKY